MKLIHLLITVMILFPLVLFSQNKETKVTSNQEVMKKSDTINKMGPNNMKTGYWEESTGGDIINKGFYQNNNKTGTWVSMTSNNLLVKLETFINGKKDGIALTFDRKNRLTNQEWYKNGQLHGLAIVFSAYNEIPVSEINYIQGKKTGTSKLYYDNGKIQEAATYKDDIKEGIVKWYNKSAKMVAEYNYMNGIFEGVQKTFYENDSLQSVSNYHNNILTGDYFEYYRNGVTKVSGKYLNGEKEGIWTENDETGKPVKTIKFKNGVPK